MNFPRSLGPAVAHASPVEAVRAGVGALVGLGVTGLLVLSPAVDLHLGLYLVAPFGASSVLLFAVPNSPLAQPWAAVVGNVLAALIGVAVSLTISDPVLRISLAVGLAISATILCRAVHPPAGAVAMTAAMSPNAVHHLGFWFALSPVATGTVSLVLIAALYARLTGRHYPFRQFDDPNRHGTQDAAPTERLGLTEEELTEILDRYRQSLNLGVEDLARLIGAAELQAVTHRTGPLTAADIMSRNLVTVAPDTSLTDVGELFRQHRFTALPVVGPDARFLGMIFQIHLVCRATDDVLSPDPAGRRSLKRLFTRKSGEALRAGDIMSVAVPRATGATPVGALLPMMADGEVDAVPVLEDAQVIGIVTRTDLIAALTRAGIRDS